MTQRAPSLLVVSLACAALCAGLIVASAGCGIGSGRRSARALENYVQGVEQYHAGNTDAAIQSLQDATQRDPDLTMAHALLGDLYRSRGNYIAAAKRYESLTRLDPYTAPNHYRLGVVYHMLNRVQDAVASYIRALELDPQDARSSTNLGLAYLSLGQPEDALRYTQRATILAPNSAAAWLNLGVALETSGDYAQAESAYRRSLDLDSSQVQTMLNLGLNLVQQGKNTDALIVMEQVLERSDTPQIRKRYADALARSGQYNRAVKEYEKVLESNPQSVEAINGIAYVRIAEYRKGLELDDSKRAAAIEMWKRSLALNPNQPRVQAALQDWSQQQSGLFAN